MTDEGEDVPLAVALEPRLIFAELLHNLRVLQVQPLDFVIVPAAFDRAPINDLQSCRSRIAKIALLEDLFEA